MNITSDPNLWVICALVFLLGLLIGVLTAYLTDWFSGSIAQVTTFALIVVFLQLRPQGIFTVRTRGLA